MQTHRVVGGLSDRIREVILENDVDLTVISKRLGITRSLLWAYMYNDTTPNATNLMKIAAGFSVSADWLLGLSDVKQTNRSADWINEEIDKREKKNELYSNSIKDFRNSMNLSQRQFAFEIGVTEKTIRNWESGKFIPFPCQQTKLKTLGWEGINE